MSKRELSKEAHYKNIISKQKKIIQKLQKQIGRAGKIEERYADLDDREEALLEQEVPTPKNSKNNCPRCHGALDVIDGTRIKVYVCQDCNYRASKKL